MAEISVVAIPHTSTPTFCYGQLGPTHRVQAKVPGSGTWNTRSGDRLLDVVGIVDFFDWHGVRYVLQVEVKEEYRGQGISRELFDYSTANLPEGMDFAHIFLGEENKEVVEHMINKYRESGVDTSWTIEPKKPVAQL